MRVWSPNGCIPGYGMGHSLSHGKTAVLGVYVPLAIEVAARTDVGCVRANNEDNFGYDIRNGIFVVCDGVGGHAAGELASRIAVDSLLRFFAKGVPGDRAFSQGDRAHESPGNSMPLNQAIQLANDAIREAASLDEERSGMSSTIACALVDGDLVSIGHVGDSRVYLIRERAIQPLTQDHSLVVQGSGEISRTQAQALKLQNIITRALGPEEVVEPDFDSIIAATGDVFVLATDGLTKVVSDEEILSAVTSAANLETACDSLMEMASDKGSDDNATCLLVRLVEQPWYRSVARRLQFWRGNNGTAVS
jgi:serine/threonine protein phosphatase PrpC